MRLPLSIPRILSQALFLGMVLLFLAPAAPRAAGDVGPMRLGLPGLWDTMVGPELGGAPLRLGIYGEHGTIDDGHGFTGPGILPPVTTQQLFAHLGFRLSHGVILGASLPYRRYDIPSSDTVPAASAAGVGDFHASVSVHLFSVSGGNWRTGLWGSIRMPTGDVDKGLSTNKTEGEYGLHSTLVLFRKSAVPETRITFNVGYRYNNNELNGYGNLTPDYSRPDSTGVFPPLYPALAGDDLARDNDHLLLRGGVEFRRSWAHIFVEWSADYLAWYDGAKYSESASWITPGVYLGAEGGLALKAAWSIGLWADDASTAYTPRLPDWIFSAGLSMPLFLGGRDRDQDGISDKNDACPKTPEDIDGFQDEDGCPDRDNDGDGIEDRYDLAPNLAEDFDDFEDHDGRPDLDNDGDGIPDTEDGCPNQPEDFDGFQDEDGCPDVILDADGDGIEDKDDICPQDAEDFDGYEDDDGCPDPDNDLDGINDVDDQCPDEPEDYDGDRDDDGCPDTDTGSDADADAGAES